jgi:hypothetical protein
VGHGSAAVVIRELTFSMRNGLTGSMRVSRRGGLSWFRSRPPSGLDPLSKYPHGRDRYEPTENQQENPVPRWCCRLNATASPTPDGRFSEALKPAGNCSKDRRTCQCEGYEAEEEQIHDLGETKPCSFKTDGRAHNDTDDLWSLWQSVQRYSNQEKESKETDCPIEPTAR